MVYWETAEQENPSAPDHELEFARIWKALPKIVVVGGGTPFFAPVDATVNLELAETRTFSSRVVYVRYRRV